jgi:hypothetical protein
MFSALLLVKAAISRSGGFSRLITARTPELSADPRDFALRGSIELKGVKFKRNIVRGRTNEIDVATVFARFLKDAGLNIRSQKSVEFNGAKYLTFSNSDGTVIFDCQFDPRIHEAWTPDAKIGFAGDCNFWFAVDAPKFISRTLRAAIARSTINVANERGTVNPRLEYNNRQRFGGVGVAPVKDPETLRQEQEQANEPMSEDSLRLFERIAKGQNFRMRIN